MIYFLYVNHITFMSITIIIRNVVNKMYVIWKKSFHSLISFTIIQEIQSMHNQVSWNLIPRPFPLHKQAIQ